MITRTKFNPNNIPAQLAGMIQDLNDPRNDGWVTQNIKVRLLDIIEACEAAIKKYDGK